MNKRMDSDRNPPKSLPTTAAYIRCSRCETQFPTEKMRWDHRRGLWVCASWPDCQGTGFHCDLHAAGEETGNTDACASQLLQDQLITLAAACQLLPRRNGKKVHYSTVYRWATKGTRGRKLESRLVGGVRYTSIEGLRRFVAEQPTTDQSDALRTHLYGKSG